MKTFPPRCSHPARRGLAGWWLVVLLWGVGFGGAWGETGSGGKGETGADPGAEVEASYAALRSVAAALQALGDEEKTLQTQLAAAKDEVTKKELETKLAALKQRADDQEQGFESVALNLSGKAQEEVEAETGDASLQSQMAELLQPLMAELQEVTARPRMVEQLRGEIRSSDQDVIRVEAGLSHLREMRQLAAQRKDNLLLAPLSELEKVWSTRLAEAQSQKQVTELRLRELEAEQGPVFGAVTTALKGFFLSRGVNLLLAVLAVVIAFFGLRWIHAWVIRFSPWHQRKHLLFPARVFNVVWLALTTLGAAAAGLGVLYLSGDWVLLGLALVGLVAMLLAAKGGLPRFYSQARLLLNVGEVREGERVVIDGVPWLVETIRVFSKLTNPAMPETELRMPLEQLAKMRSRPHDPSEPWFPALEGQWVLLADGSIGKVVELGPEYVQLVHLGNSRSTMTTVQFNELTPRNLSSGFRVSTVFGVDYRHQAECLDKIPEILQREILEGLIEMVGPENLRHLQVEFRAAGASSLDYEVLADFVGEVADKYQKLHRAMQRLCVASANRHGWVIPFQQVVVHRAESA